jgi:hypothetical protein
LQPAEADSPSIGRRRFTETAVLLAADYLLAGWRRWQMVPIPPPTL